MYFSRYGFLGCGLFEKVRQSSSVAVGCTHHVTSVVWSGGGDSCGFALVSCSPLLPFASHVLLFSWRLVVIIIG